MNEKTAKTLRKFSEIQGTSYDRNKRLYLSSKGANRRALSIMINKVVEEAKQNG